MAQLLAGGAKLRRAVLGHLSRDCNTPELAVATMRHLTRAGIADLEILAASQTEISARFVIEDRPQDKPEPADDVLAARVGEEAPPRVARKRNDLLQLDLFGQAAA